MKIQQTKHGEIVCVFNAIFPMVYKLSLAWVTGLNNGLALPYCTFRNVFRLNVVYQLLFGFWFLYDYARLPTERSTIHCSDASHNSKFD